MLVDTLWASPAALRRDATLGSHRLQSCVSALGAPTADGARVLADVAPLLTAGRDAAEPRLRAAACHPSPGALSIHERGHRRLAITRVREEPYGTAVGRPIYSPREPGEPSAVAVVGALREEARLAQVR